MSSDVGTSAGTILGPVLFIAYIHDTPPWSRPKFADDLNGITAALTTKEVEAKLQDYVSEMVLWYLQNGLSLNFDKIKVMLFGSEDNIHISIDGISLEQAVSQGLSTSDSFSCKEIFKIHLNHQNIQFWGPIQRPEKTPKNGQNRF